MFRKILVPTLLVLAFAIVATPASAQTSGTTSISINLPSFVMLYYRSSISIVPSDATMTALIGEASNPVDGGNVNLTSFVDDAGVDGTSGGFAPLGTVATEISNFWAVRSLAPSGGSTEVGVTWQGGGATATLTNPDSDTIGLSALQTQADGGSWGASDTFSPTGLGAGGIQQGHVRFNADLSTALTSGNYSGAAVVITAQNI